MILSGCLLVGLLSCAQAGPTLTLTEEGEGLQHTVWVESTGLFRLGFENKLNYGLSVWYDLVNDPEAKLDLAHAPVGGDSPCVGPDGWRQTEQGALCNHVLYPVDYHANHYSATWAHPDLPRQLTIHESSPVRCIIDTVCHPVVNNTATRDFEFVTRYVIYASGRLFVQTGMRANKPTEFKEWRVAVIGLGDPTFHLLITEGDGALVAGESSIRVPGATWQPNRFAGCQLNQPKWKTWPIVSNTTDTITVSANNRELSAGEWAIQSSPKRFGWLRATDTQDPYEWSKDEALCLFMHWDPETPEPFTDWTKASILVAPSPDRTRRYGNQPHEWDLFKRHHLRCDGITLAPGQAEMQSFMYQLGTRGSDILPAIDDRTVARRLAREFSEPLTVSDGDGVFDPETGAVALKGTGSPVAVTLDTQGTAHRYPLFLLPAMDRVARVTLDGQAVDFTQAQTAEGETLVQLWTIIREPSRLLFVAAP